MGTCLQRIHDLEFMLRKVMEEEERTGDSTGRLMGLLTGALSSISAFMAEHYVEMIHKFILVNVPSFISTIWSIVKPLLPERTKNKVKIFGSNWKSEILEYANPEVHSRPRSERAVPFPESGYYNQGPLTDARQLDVPAGKTGCVTVEAAKGQKFSWTFQTDGHFARCPAPLHVPLDDHIECSEAGVYKLWFSNEHAWLHTLRVHYRIKLE
ncbi:CRAL-TRIO domain-containing protein [Aphelenchoides fujianensis]|nr:CRAL-TRIO domain-containing protein [Aphelenchoides fujianensis]